MKITMGEIRPEYRDPCILDLLSRRSGDAARHLDLEDCREIINASAFAVEHGRGHTAHLTIRWDKMAGFVVRDWVEIQGRLLDKMSRWLRRNSIPVSFIWIREMGRTNGPHTHLLLHLPHQLRPDLKAFLLESGDFTPPDASGEALQFDKSRYGTHTPHMRAGHLRYLLKSADPNATVRAPPADGGTRPLLEALGVDDGGERRLPIVGKRCSSSYTIGATMRRDFGWKELTTIAELRSYLHPPR